MAQNIVLDRISALPPPSLLLPCTASILTRPPIFPIPNKPFFLSVPAFAPTSLRTGSGRDKTRVLCADGEQGGHWGPFECQGFSVLPQEVPWNDSDVWSTMALYIFGLHIPLSFGGLGAVCQLLNRVELDPLTEASSIFVLQTLELMLTSVLIRYTVGSWDKISVVLQKQATTKRNFLTSSAAGLGILIFVVLVTSFIADQLIGPKDVNNPILRDMLAKEPTSKAFFFLVYCLVTPILEEVVYRGFLLTTLASKMKWQQAVLTSACIFSFAHLSSENALQLFVIGIILGSVYCRTGNLLSSILVHSVYNAAILTITML